MKADWFYLRGSHVVGPLTAADLRGQAGAGQVTPETPVRRGEVGNWTPAKKVKGLFDGPAVPPPPPVVVAAPPAPPVEPPRPVRPPPAKAVGGIGGLFILGGLVTWGGAKK